MARLETLQSNVKQLEAQALEMHKLKCTLEKDLEAERLLREQKAKVWGSWTWAGGAHSFPSHTVGHIKEGTAVVRCPSL